MRFLALLASTLIIIAVLLPGSNIPDVGVVGVDKFVHIVMFAGWAVAVRYDFPTMKPWLIFVSGLVFSVLTEILQLFIEGRSFDLYDMIADGAGLLLGLLLTKPALRIINFIFTPRR